LLWIAWRSDSLEILFEVSAAAADFSAARAERQAYHSANAATTNAIIETRSENAKTFILAQIACKVGAFSHLPIRTVNLRFGLGLGLMGSRRS